MNHAFIHALKPASLALGVSLGILGQAQAQMTGGAGLSSGSGSGTGSGASSGIQRNPSGSLSGVGPRRGSQDEARTPFPPFGTRAPRPHVPFGPGVDVTFPTDPYVLPFVELEQQFSGPDDKSPTQITNSLLKSARLITSPDERSLALQRIANGARKPAALLAHQVLEEATEAASQVTTPLVRDQRLIAIVKSMTGLTEAMLLQGRQLLNETAALENLGKPEPLPKGADPNVLIRGSRLEWKRAAYLAQIIGNPTYKNQMLYEVAESMASGSASIANEYVMAVTPEPSRAPRPPEPATPAPAPATPTPKPAADAAPRAAEPAKSKNSNVEAMQKTADDILVESYDIARKCDRLIWRYRAMVRIALLAADSDQYKRGFELAKGIENGESRAEAMLLLAEAQARDGQNAGATLSYQEAAKAVATVQQDGLRGVLAGFVVDSLITSGRFQDAQVHSALSRPGATAGRTGCRRRVSGPSRLCGRSSQVDSCRDSRGIPLDTLSAGDDRSAHGDRAR